MSEANKSYRIRTDVGVESTNRCITLDANLVQDYNTFDVLSVSINSVDTYKLHNSNYGVVVGRVLANNGFGVPNAKISIFISADSEDGAKLRELYPYSSSKSKNNEGIRYNLLPDNQVSDCHQIVGTFPNKRYTLDNDVVLEVFDKYYAYTTRTNNAGDYLIMGVPTGAHTLHMDLDLSDCGILSQRPRDFVYKGYTIEQFENPNMFKTGTTYDTLSQVFTQDQVVNVNPFWGNSSLGETIGLTRADVNISFKFEPTCVFLGSVTSDRASQGISKKCIPTDHMGSMDELVTGEGKIEMIRKTPGGSVEEFQIKGTQLINENGIWCYQIPMNLDYMMTDEYGNMVPTDDPDKGIPTRARVRFRMSMQDSEVNTDNYFRPKVLVPHNPQNLVNGQHEDYDYEFGTLTREDSFRDLFWNNVYTVKSYIPRFQRKKARAWKDKNFSGIKGCNFYGQNNPIPYNNIRIRLPFMFTVMCAIIKCFIFITGVINTIISMYANMLASIGAISIPTGIKVSKPLKIELKWSCLKATKKLYSKALSLKMNVLKEGLCPDLENWYFAPMFIENLWQNAPKPKCDDGAKEYNLLRQTLDAIIENGSNDDPQSIDDQNEDPEDNETICLTIHTDYLLACIEMNLAMEYRVINFDFYNDWINGLIYFPRFMRYLRPKKKFLGITFARAKIKGCMDNTKIFSKTRRYTQQCSIGYKPMNTNEAWTYTSVDNPLGSANPFQIAKANNFHKKRGLSQKTIFGKNGGICHEQATMLGQYVYYLKPCEWTRKTSPASRKVSLFATDIVLLGSLNDCDLFGIPQSFKHLGSTSYVMPTNLALTNMETDGPLYATNKGTICAGQSSTSEEDVLNNDKGVQIVSNTSGSVLYNELMYLSGAGNTDIADVQYEEGEESDTIAMTEAAGISWNWTGPGQGEIDKKRMYYPGGHFLGLSCVNSQTNLKSCINLERVCEAGATISQRREDVSGMDKDGNLQYTYSVPSGFIAGDEIVDADFRTMFATMNQNRLIATKVNPDTGYKMYDFLFVKPTNFDGAFKKTMNSRSSNLYNRKLGIEDENNEKKSLLKKFGIALGISRDDYDPNESENTQVRTIEDPSIDYYLYRFGLDYENLNKNDELQLRKFLISSGTKQYLPQFENSYYFYFGMKDGATAIDEFNKQFFSQCAESRLITKEATLNLTVDLDLCVGSGTIHGILNNVSMPLISISYYSDVDKTPIYLDSEYLNNYQFDIEGIKFGNYTVIVIDNNGTEYTKKISVGADLASSLSQVYDFNISDETKWLYTPDIFRGGYIKVWNINIEGFTGKTVNLYITDADGNQEGGKYPVSIGALEDAAQIIFVKHANVYYNLYVEYNCGQGDQSIILTQFLVKNGSSIQLLMGDKNIMTVSPLLNTQLMWHMNENMWFVNGHPIGIDEKQDTTNWLYRVCMFNEINDSLNDTRTFDNKVFAVNGNKTVWGPLQKGGSSKSSWEILKDRNVYSTDEPENWKPGYELNDEMQYFQTVGVNYSPSITQYSAIATNDNTVCGDYRVRQIDGDIEVPYRAGFFNNTYVFKPIPEGDIEFHIGGQPLPVKEYKNGIFYPTFVYSAIKRPFYAKANFILAQYRDIEFGNDSNGDGSAQIVDYEVGGATEIEIHNGITYQTKFSSSSTVSNFEEGFEFAYTNGMHDMSGVTMTESKDRILSFSSNTWSDEYGYAWSEEQDDASYAYEIVEGYPSEVNGTQNMVNSIYGSVDSFFHQYILYSVDENNQISIWPTSDGDISESTARYYLCKEPGNVEILYQKDNDETETYIWVEDDDHNLYAVFTYTSAATFDSEGSPLIVHLWGKGHKGYKKNARRYAEFYLTNEDGSKRHIYAERLEGGKMEGKKNTIEAAAKTWPEIAPVKKIRIVKQPKINKEASSWEEVIKVCKNWGENHTYSTGDKLFVVGEIETRSESNPDGFAKLYKIYPNLVRINKPPIVDDEDLVINPTGATVDTKEGKVLVDVVSASTDITWKTVFEGNITAVNPSTGLGPTTGVSISYAENKDNLEKTGTVEFYYFEPGQDATFVLKQKKADDSGDDINTGKTITVPYTIVGNSVTVQAECKGGSQDGNENSDTDIKYVQIAELDLPQKEITFEFPDIILSKLDVSQTNRVTVIDCSMRLVDSNKKSITIGTYSWEWGDDEGAYPISNSTITISKAGKYNLELYVVADVQEENYQGSKIKATVGVESQEKSYSYKE